MVAERRRRETVFQCVHDFVDIDDSVLHRNTPGSGFSGGDEAGLCVLILSQAAKLVAFQVAKDIAAERR